MVSFHYRICPRSRFKAASLKELSCAGVYLSKAPLPATVATSCWQMLLAYSSLQLASRITVTENGLIGWNDGWHAWKHGTCLSVNWYFLISSGTKVNTATHHFQFNYDELESIMRSNGDEELQQAYGDIKIALEITRLRPVIRSKLHTWSRQTYINRYTHTHSQSSSVQSVPWCPSTNQKDQIKLCTPLHTHTAQNALPQTLIQDSSELLSRIWLTVFLATWQQT